MATKFASIYKQELRSKGALSSMGSAVLKSARERMDVRNIFFGGKGMLSATGQKTFGRGYSALSGGMSTPSNSQMAAQSVATGELLSSNERQEALLRVVAKNTFNMNLMARDMNITRQNIATLTRLAAGKAAKSQDALWYDVKTRNQAIDSLGRKSKPNDSNAPTKSSGSSFLGSILGGAGNVLSAIGSVLGSVLGTVGAGVLGVFKTVMALSPILAIIGIAATAYVIKELSKIDFGLGNIIDFEPIKKRIYDAIGYDPNSEKTFVQQMAAKLDDVFKTTKFTEGTKFIEKNFGPLADDIGRSIATITDVTLVYIRAAYQTLADSFSSAGKLMGFYYGDFLNQHQGKIFAVIGAVIGARFGIQGAALSAALGGVLGLTTAEIPLSQLPDAVDKMKKEVEDFQKNSGVPGGPATNLKDALERRQKGGLFEQGMSLNQRQLLQKYDRLVEMQTRLSEYNEAKGSANVSENFSKYLKQYTDELPGGRPGGGYMNRFNQTPEQIPSTDVSSSLSNVKWKDLSEEQKNALLTAQAQSEGYTPGKLPYELKNPGAMIYADWQTQFGGKRGRTVTDNFGITRTFTEFPTHEQGRAAQRWLWDNGKPAGTPGYANMTLLDAFKKWVAPHKEEAAGFQNYIGNVLKQIKGVPGVQISEMSSDLNSAQRTFMASSGGGGETTVNNVTNNYSAGRGDSQAVAGVINAEAMYLFT
jgi:hypothetical protein